MKTAIRVMIIIAMVIISSSFAAQAGDIKLSRNLLLPDDVKIIPPSSTLPPQLAMLSGVWEGDWEGNLDAALVVENITENGGSIVYSWGDYWPWNITKGYHRSEIKIDGDTIIFISPSKKVTSTVKALNKNTIIILREAPTYTKETKLKRVKVQ